MVAFTAGADDTCKVSDPVYERNEETVTAFRALTLP